MEFLNIGGGELLVIVLLALVLFGPDDILRIMRTVGKYTRGIQRMWSQVNSSLREDYLPDEVKEVVKETKGTLADAGVALKEASTVVKEVTSTANQELGEATSALGKDAVQAVTTLEKNAAQAAAAVPRSTAPKAAGKATPSPTTPPATALSPEDQATPQPLPEPETPAVTQPEPEPAVAMLPPAETDQEAPVDSPPESDSELTPAERQEMPIPPAEPETPADKGNADDH